MDDWGRVEIPACGWLGWLSPERAVPIDIRSLRGRPTNRSNSGRGIVIQQCSEPTLASHNIDDVRSQEQNSHLPHSAVKRPPVDLIAVANLRVEAFQRSVAQSQSH